ncbi:GtrA family protein [Salinibacillus xinjiangensis]|uniref:GtrA family protein n=1 Tax=Salinibacillus xinjiangensis TaxID=1229268 RepID=UPI00129B5378|nr:GtrA family protein [Salinibacillus xinjiangensis]
MFKKLLLFLSFVAVSGIGWLIDFVVYTILVEYVKLSVFVSNIASALPAITFVFLASTNKVFKSTNPRIRLIYKYFVYFGYQALLLLLISWLAQFIYDFIYHSMVLPQSISSNLALWVKVLITPITLLANYIVMKTLIEKL